MTPIINTWSESKKQRLLTSFNKGVSTKDITNVFGCSARSMYRVLDELHAQGHTVKWRGHDNTRGSCKEGNSVGAAEA
jgi:DNA invertase Pin-like site-specific DNA recombinase